MGLGKIMAQGAMSSYDEKRQIRCPLCGEPMEFESVGWFCRAGSRKNNGAGAHSPCDLTELEDAFLSPGDDRWFDDWEMGVLLAGVVVSEDNIPVKLMTIRGHGGQLNLKVDLELHSGLEFEDVPGIINEHGWTWMEWVPPEATCPANGGRNG